MNLADKVFLNVAAQASEAVLLLVSSVIMVRFYSKTDYGTFLQIMLLVNTVIMLTFMGLPQSIYYYYQKVASKTRFLFNNLVLSLGIGGLAALFCWIFAGQLSGWLNNPDLKTYALFSSLMIFFRSPTALRDPVLISSRHLILNSGVMLLCNLIFYCPIIACTLLSAPLGTLLQVMTLSSGIHFLIVVSMVVWLALRVKPEAGKYSPEGAFGVGFIDQIRYALPIGISSQLGVLGRQVDQYIVSIFFLPIDFAIYSRGAMRVPVLSSIHYTVNNIMMPRYIKAYQDKHSETFLRHYHKSIEKVAKINIPVFFFLFTAAPLIVSLLYTDQYLGSVGVLRVYLFLLVIGIAVYAVAQRASGKTTFIFYATVLSFFINIFLSLLLIRFMGPVGAALATVISILGASLFLLSNACRILNIPFKRIFPWRFLKELILISLIASIPVALINGLGGGRQIYPFILLMMDMIVYGYVFMLIIMRTRLLEEDDFLFLKKWLRFDVETLIKRMVFIRA